MTCLIPCMNTDLTLFAVDPFKSSAGAVTLRADLGVLQEDLGCTDICIPKVRIGEMEFRAICDKKGAKKLNARASAVDKNWTQVLAGRILIAGNFESDEGHEELCGLTDEEVEYLTDHITLISARQGLRRYVTCSLYDVEYI